MKKLVLAFFAVSLAFGAFSQNIQTHYDMGKDRGYFTTTVEMFKPDKTGNTFFFIDMDYGSGGVKNSPSLAYFEIARCFTLGKSPFSWHVEYNGGLFNSHGYANNISNAWLTGLDYSWNAKDFSKGFSLKALYKNSVYNRGTEIYHKINNGYMGVCVKKSANFFFYVGGRFLFTIVLERCIICIE